MASTWNNFSVGSHHEDGPQAISEELPACGSCRKRKLRCSREHPACSHCERLGITCVYEPKQKPGLKAGAVEALTRRVAFLEDVILDEAGNVRPQFNTGDKIKRQRQEESPLTNNDGPSHQETSPADPNPLESPATHASVGTQPHVEDDYYQPRKRIKLGPSVHTESLLNLEFDDIFEYLPSQSLLGKLVDYFCVTFHHWIPYLHKQRLRTKVCNLSRDPKLSLVLHALVAATLRHLSRDESLMCKEQVLHQTQVSRFIAETFALKNASLESLRALIIIVFDYLNDGQSRKAWPLIGSLTRTVDYLQLTVEPTASQFGALMNPLKLVQPTDDWTELEERRRLFWVIFLLDRFCSVSTGWNTSLTSEDVHRRLPADGGYFTREEPVTTPYFGIWNKSSAKIGKSLAHVPAQYNEEDPVADQVQGTSPSSSNTLIDASKLGAFAYCIEATESLSQVTTFFLQQRIRWQDKEQAVNWLTRFKELDLRLVHWKLFLPPRWKDSNISPVTEVVDMDPNLTLAHITHNTSMILLHHPIAYPPKEWNNYVALPKECSAQTCELAAVETTNIVHKFLTHRVVFVNVQFAFCCFVAAKALLFESQATNKPIKHEFCMLIRSLWEISARWRADSSSNDGRRHVSNQAGIYSRHLEYLLEACQRDTRFRFNLYDHSCQEQDTVSSTSPAGTASTPTPSQPGGTPASLNPPHVTGSIHPPPPPLNISPNTPNLANILYTNTTATTGPPTPTTYHQPPSTVMPPPHTRTPSFDHPKRSAIYPSSTSLIHPQQQQQLRPQNPNPTSTPTPNGTAVTVQDESLLSLSDALMDSQFLGMDRVITFEDANFFLPGDGFRWQ